MRRSARHETLLSIYGAPQAASQPPRVVRRPTTRPTSSASSKAALGKKWIKQPSEGCEILEDEVSSSKPREEDERNDQFTAYEVVKLNEEVASFQPDDTDVRVLESEKAEGESQIVVPSSPQHTLHKPKGNSLVLAFYGDGFLEVRQNQESQQLLVQDPCGIGSFTIELLVFKAADVGKPAVIVESDKSRHRHPELDDNGAFVRWTCCGNTDPSVYGCSVAIKQESKDSELPSIYTETPTPKLLAARLPAQEIHADMGFVIYDRGASRKWDSGCRVWNTSFECWVNQYEIPSNRWVRFTAVFDSRYLHVYFDNTLVDCAHVQAKKSKRYVPSSPRERLKRSDSQWIAGVSATVSSFYVGGHPSYSRSVSEWRTRIGFVGLIGSFLVRTTSIGTVLSSKKKAPNGNKSTKEDESAKQEDVVLVHLRIPGVGKVIDASTFHQSVNCRRTIFWRQVYPHFPTPAIPGVLILNNFFHGGHNDLAVSHAKSFENLLLSVVQTADFRIVIEYSPEADFRIGRDYGCRSQLEYEQKAVGFIRGIENMSTLLSVLVNESKMGPLKPPIGSFEIHIELSRAQGRKPILIELHSMASSGCFPNEFDIKKKIESIVLFEAKRPQGEEIYTQAIRYFLALAEPSRNNRERIFLESVINRKIVITERKIVSLFQKIGFFFAPSEIQDVVKFFKNVQNNYARNRGRIEDLPSLSMLSPTPDGMYTLPFVSVLSLSATLTVGGSAHRSPWRFVCVLLDYDYQLVDFLHEDCPTAQSGGLTYRQSRYLFGGFVDRLQMNLSDLSARVFCVLFSLSKRSGVNDPVLHGVDISMTNQFSQSVRVQFENAEAHHVLGMFDVVPTNQCRWLTLGCVYRAKKSGGWQLQALGHSSDANSLHASVEKVTSILCERQVIKTYEVKVYYARDSTQFEDFASRFSQNIRFGRNGCIVAVPIHENKHFSGAQGADKTFESLPRLKITLKLQHLGHDIDVYTHENQHHALPTVQSIYRSLINVLAENGIKESLQQNPFVTKERREKRSVAIRIVGESSNQPVSGAHVFIERNLEYGKLSTSLAKKVVPTLTMGSRLVSIRRRLQKTRFLTDVRTVASAFVEEAIRLGSKLALLTLRRDSKLMPLVRSRTLLRAAMRRRYEKIRNNIFHVVQQSEHARIYSRSAPIRLRQLLATSLDWSSSERDLMQQFSRNGFRILDEDDSRYLVDDGANPDPNTVFAEWEAQKRQTLEAADQSNDTADKVLTTEEKRENDTDGAEIFPMPNIGKSDPCGVLRLHKKHFVTDDQGMIKCHLAPGTYTLYVFHVEFFEWTSVAVVYPPVNTSGSFGGSTSFSSSTQQILIPLEGFRWSYTIQLVDFYQQHLPKRIAGIPLAITDKCGSFHSIVTTDVHGRAAWDVSKGLYAIGAAPNCPCILYSAFKNIVVDGSRLRTSRTISVPVLFGKIKVDLAVVGLGDILNDKKPLSVAIYLCRVKNSPSRGIREVDDLSNSAEGVEIQTALNSVNQLQLRLGTYRLRARASGCFASSAALMKVEWQAADTPAKQLVVVTRAFSQPHAYRVVFYFIPPATINLSLMIEVSKDKVPLGFAWHQDVPPCLRQHVALEGADRFHEWEFQSFLLTCQEGFSYKSLVAPSIHQFHPRGQISARIEVYSAAGCIYERAISSSSNSSGGFCSHICSWNSVGELILLTS